MATRRIIRIRAAAGAGGEGKDRHLHNPIEDRLIPLEPLDLGKVRRSMA